MVCVTDNRGPPGPLLRNGYPGTLREGKTPKSPGKRRKNSMSEAKKIAKAQVAGGPAPHTPHACPSHRH